MKIPEIADLLQVWAEFCWIGRKVLTSHCCAMGLLRAFAVQTLILRSLSLRERGFELRVR